VVSFIGHASAFTIPSSGTLKVQVSTKSDDGFAKIINVIPMPQPSKIVIIAIWSLVFVGASFLFYWLARIAIAAI
jgi:hypothetical protein